MNLYFAGWGSREADSYLRSKNAHRLLSQVNENKLIDEWYIDGLAENLFIDSGAFTVAHSDVEVSIDDYIAFINSHSDIKIWAELDEIPYPVLTMQTAKVSCENSWNNYQYMRDKVTSDCNILPIYHFGEPISALKRICNSDADYIGVGGRHGVSTNIQIQYFDKVFSAIHTSNNPNIKVHAFGITVPKILMQFPFYSADSTTWLQVAINGGILSKDLTTVLVSDRRLSSKNMNTVATEHLSTLLDEVEYFGYSFTELVSDWRKRLLYNIDVMLDWEHNYTYKGLDNFSRKRTLF